jgi:hypothetical protein
MSQGDTDNEIFSQHDYDVVTINFNPDQIGIYCKFKIWRR